MLQTFLIQFWVNTDVCNDLEKNRVVKKICHININFHSNLMIIITGIEKNI